MISRGASKKVRKLLEKFPVVGIVGPRQIGKTTLVKSLLDEKSIYLDLESDVDLPKLTEPGLFFRTNSEKLIIIDEIQQMPELFPLLRSIVDENRRPGRFIILGSASPVLLRKSSESLAGRIAYMELTPFHLNEVGEEHITELWMKGGFPNSFLEDNNQTSVLWRNQLIRAYLERDLPALGLNVERRLLHNFLRMLANNTGQLWNAMTFAKSLGITSPTVKKYLDFMEGAFLVDVIEPFFMNMKKRLVKSPKVYFKDTGLLHALLGIPDLNTLQGNLLIGNSWENYVIQQIKNELGDTYEYYFYRTREGTEADLVLVKGGIPEITIEIKYTSSPKVSRGLKIAIEDLGSKKNFILIPTGERYPIHDNIEVIGLGDFLNLFSK